jgi:two-component system response regulator AtoC
MRRLLRVFLVRAGYEVLEAGDGRDAIARLESDAVDVVILDKEMPGMNGLDVLAYLRQRRSTVPVILVTAFGGSAVAEEARRRGARRYLEKPFRLAAVVEAVQAVLESCDR